MAMRAQRTRRMPKGKTTRRECLRCDKGFSSLGAHNRLCDPCRQSIAVAPTPETEHTFSREDY